MALSDDTYGPQHRPADPAPQEPVPEPRHEAPRQGPPRMGPPQPPMPEARKDMGVAWLLWFFLGGFGGHNFYLRKPGAATTQLILSLIGFATVWFIIGSFFLVPVAIWWIIDAFLINGRVREINEGIWRNEQRYRGGY